MCVCVTMYYVCIYVYIYVCIIYVPTYTHKSQWLIHFHSTAGYVTLCYTEAVQCAAVTVITLHSLSLTHEATNCAISSRLLLLRPSLVQLSFSVPSAMFIPKYKRPIFTTVETK